MQHSDSDARSELYNVHKLSTRDGAIIDHARQRMWCIRPGCSAWELQHEADGHMHFDALTASGGVQRFGNGLIAHPTDRRTPA